MLMSLRACVILMYSLAQQIDESVSGRENFRFRDPLHQMDEYQSVWGQLKLWSLKSHLLRWHLRFCLQRKLLPITYRKGRWVELIYMRRTNKRRCLRYFFRGAACVTFIGLCSNKHTHFPWDVSFSGTSTVNSTLETQYLMWNELISLIFAKNFSSEFLRAFFVAVVLASFRRIQFRRPKICCHSKLSGAFISRFTYTQWQIRVQIKSSIYTKMFECFIREKVLIKSS